MAIIYSYPYVSTVNNSDTLVISVSDTTANNGFLTKSLTADNLASYVTARVNLNFGGDTGTGVVNLDTQSLSIEGTANEIETVAIQGNSRGILTIGLPNNVTITNNLTVGGSGSQSQIAGFLNLTEVFVTDTLEVDGDTTLNNDLDVSGDTTIGGSLEVTNTLTVGDNQANGSTIDSLLSMSANRITDLSNPINAQDAATKVYVDTAVTGLLDFKGTFRADTGEILSGTNVGSYIYNCPGGAGTRVAIAVGDYYIVANAGGQFYCSGDLLQVGDSIVASQDAAADSSTVNDWGVLEGNNVEGTGLANTIPLWTDSQILGNSVLSEETGTAYGATKNLVVNGNIYQSNMGTSVSIGENALANGTAGTLGENVAIGQNALNSLTVATNNIGIGVNTLQNTNANNNIAIGKNSQVGQTTGLGNISLGFNSLSVNNVGNTNIVIGHTAVQNVATGSQGISNNVILGTGAVNATTITGGLSDSVIIGTDALEQANTTVIDSTVFIGNRAGRFIEASANRDIGIGFSTFYGVNGGFKSAGDNIAIGAGAQGNNLYLGNRRSIKIGSDAGTAGSYAVNISAVNTSIYNINQAHGEHAAVIGGANNYIQDADAAFTGGGRNNTIATGAIGGAILGGFDNVVNGGGSAGMALGSNLEVTGANQVVLGRFNVANNNSKLIVGAGFSGANRINAFEVKNTSLIKLGKYGQSTPTFPVIGLNYNILVTQPNNEVREVDPEVFNSQVLVPQLVTIGGGQVVNLAGDTNKLVTVNWTGTSGTGTLRLPTAANFTNKTMQILAAGGFDPQTTPSNLNITTSFGSGETIDGQGSYTGITKLYDTVTLWSNGTEWFVLQVKT